MLDGGSKIYNPGIAAANRKRVISYRHIAIRKTRFIAHVWPLRRDKTQFPCYLLNLDKETSSKYSGFFGCCCCCFLFAVNGRAVLQSWNVVSKGQRPCGRLHVGLINEWVVKKLNSSGNVSRGVRNWLHVTGVWIVFCSLFAQRRWAPFARAAKRYERLRQTHFDERQITSLITEWTEGKRLKVRGNNSSIIQHQLSDRAIKD